MIHRPYPEDYRLISYYIGKILVGVGYLFLIPIVTAIVFREWAACFDFLIGLGVTFTVGYLFLFPGEKKKDLNWMQAMVTAAFSWLIAMVLCAIPHYLSGHFLSYLDACFDVMSGFTTTGLVLIQDLDHVSISLNMWRHLLTYIGGQGMVVLILTFLVRGTAGAYMMYVGEGKDERLLPNVIQTARAIWVISTVYLVIGSFWLTITLWSAGMTNPVQAFLHGTWIYMSSWSTGGFAPQSLNIMHYHSFRLELITMLFMILGSMNFILHYTLWTGQRQEIRKNIEIISFVVTVTLTYGLLVYALHLRNIYPEWLALFRRSGYILLSAHTGTGLQSIYAQQFLKNWGGFAMIALTLAMAFGGSACATCGGIKGLRIGLFFKGLYQEIRKIMLSENSIVVTKYHHIKNIILTDQALKMVGLIIICYMLLFLGGAILGEFYGYGFVEALFEATSAGSTTGLSCGITTPTMPTALKIYYIFAMWAGRLEFISVFGLMAFAIAIWRGK